MTTIPLKIAIIGAGLIGPRHAHSIISNPSTNLIALVEPSPHGPSIAKSLNTTHYTSITSLLSSDHKPDAAIICTPNHTHVSLSLSLIEAGIHILVEKPISTTISSGEKVIAAAKEKNVKILVGHHRRFNPYLLATKRCLDQKKLGKIVAVQGTWCLKKPSSYFDGIGSWRQTSSTSNSEGGSGGGGVILINLIHEIDLLQYLQGPITQVSALETRKERGFEAEEGAAILMRFQSGVVGTFIFCDNSPSPWNFEAGTGENPNIPKVDSEGGEGFYRILGTEGSLSVPDLTRWSYDDIQADKEKGWNEMLKRERLVVEKEKIPFDLQIQHFVDVVREEAEPSCTGEEALRALVVCEAVKRAICTGLPVYIEGFNISN